MTLANAPFFADPLAYELRRLSDMILAGYDEFRESTERSLGDSAPPGELAKVIASSFEVRGVDVDVALAVLGSEIDYEFGALLFRDRAHTELAVLAALYPRLEDRLSFADAVGADAPTVKRGLLRRSHRDGSAVLSATRRFRSAVFGRPFLSALPDFAQLITSEPRKAPWITPPLGLLEAMSAINHGCLCIVTGSAGVGKTTWACDAAYAIARPVLRIDAARAARAHADVISEIRELLDDAALLGTPIVLDNASGLVGKETGLSLLIEDSLTKSPAKLFVIASDRDDVHEALASRALAHVRVEPPPAAARRELWSNAGVSEQVRSTLADDLVLTPRQIANAIALIDAGADPAVAAFEQLPKVQNLTLPDRTSAKFDALILPPDVQQEIVELCNAIRTRGAVTRKLTSTRGKAISALFNGDSGTGKTFACEVVAADVGLPLMRVNVASLVDKYIGETEKNLVRVFAQAQAQGGILFFDEADALFGNRTDVSRAQDRYANLETNLLLQLMEQFVGIVLLTTNLKQNIDQAFMRRIMYKVFFEAPELPERERLWRSMLPASEYASNIDFTRLARTFELTGGSIRAVVQRAAYRAAARNAQISMADLVDCAQLEVQGMGRVATW